MRERPQEYAPFLAEFLESEQIAVAEAALLALGNSRRPEAFQVLVDFWKGRPPHELVETTFVAMALLRFPAASEFLLSLLAEAPESQAGPALSALAVLSYDSRIREQTAAAVERRDSPALRVLFKEKFRGE